MNELELLNATMLEEINISFLSTVYSLIATGIASALLRNVYIKYGRSMNNREYFANVFILLSITTCTVIIIVKYSLALSLGLVGALSIVRFRAAIKEPEELVYLFLTIALGLSFGANQFAVGFTLLCVSIFIIWMSSKFLLEGEISDHTGMVCIISGNKSNIIFFKKEYLHESVKLSRNTILKEYSLQDDFGQIVLKVSSNEKSEEMLMLLEKRCIESDLNLQIVSEVSVPA